MDASTARAIAVNDERGWVYVMVGGCRHWADPLSAGIWCKRELGTTVQVDDDCGKGDVLAGKNTTEDATIRPRNRMWPIASTCQAGSPSPVAAPSMDMFGQLAASLT
jgi:hypothetical protein